MADARLIIHHHRNDGRWARCLRRVGEAYQGVLVLNADEVTSGAEGAPAPKHIHICSPAYASEPRALDWGEHIALIVAGEPGAAAFTGAEDEECLPLALQNVQRVEGRADRLAAGDNGAASQEDAASAAIAAALGVDIALVRKPLKRRRQRHLAYCGLAVLGAIALLFGGTALRDNWHTAERADAFAAAQTARIAALDAGDDAAAYAAFALDGAWGQTAEGEVTLHRAMSETRLLADVPAPAAKITGLSFLPGGVIAATGADGGAWLVDTGAGVATQISAPSAGAVGRLSPAGDRLWIARPGAPTLDETGNTFVPLAFVDVDLAQGDVVAETVIRTPPGRLDEGAISPDGELFATDMGPGEGVETLIAAFRRGSQTLGGVLRLPSDQAKVQFVGPDRLLAVVNPPSAYGVSPGLYLWRVGVASPIMLRREGLAPICPDDAKGTHADTKPDPKPVQQAQARGELATPQVLTAPSGREIALLLPRLGRGACLLRWAVPSGAALETISVPGRASSAALLAEGGPYLIRRDRGAATLLRPGAPATTLAACRTGAILPVSRPGGRAEAFLCGDGNDGVLASPDGAVWRRHMHDGGVEVATQGPGGRIATYGRDGRIRLWDGAPRLTRLAAGLRDATSFHVVPSAAGPPHVAALFPSGLVWVFDAEGQASGPIIQTDVTAPHLRIFAPDRVVVMGARGGAQHWRTLNLLTGEASPGASLGASARFLPRGPVIKGGGWTRQIVVADDGATRVKFHTRDGGRVLVDFDHQAGTTAKMLREPGGAMQVQLSIGAVTHIQSFKGQGGAVRLSPDGSYALLRIEAAAPPHIDEFYVIDTESGQHTRVNDAPETSGWIGFSASGATFAIRSVDQLADIPVLAGRDGARIGVAPGGRSRAVWSPVGDMFATANAGRVTISEVGIGSVARRCEVDAPSRHLAFTPDGRALISASLAGGVSVLDIETCTVRLRAPDVRAKAVPFAAAADVIWVPTLAGVTILRLDDHVPNAGEMIRRRARALAATR